MNIKVDGKKFVRYYPGVETPLANESQIIDGILVFMKRLSDITKKEYGHHVRVSHTKSHGLAIGELIINNLPRHLSQGLFAAAGTYPVIVRLANVAGEIWPDAFNTQGGFAFKILGITGHKGQHTADQSS